MPFAPLDSQALEARLVTLRHERSALSQEFKKKNAFLNTFTKQAYRARDAELENQEKQIWGILGTHEELNRKINRYNNVTTLEEKKRHLENLSLLDSDLPVDIVTHMQNEIEKQYRELGINLPNKLQFPDNPKDFLNKMAPQKLQEMLSLLETNGKLDGLYGNNNTQESRAFARFLSQNSIIFLGGANARNYKIVSKTKPDELLILKVEKRSRLAQPLDVITYLENTSMKHSLARVDTRREVGNGEIRISLTEFCQEGDLKQHAKKHSTLPQHLEATLKYFTQMAELFKNIEAEQCAFPDAKNENILVNNGQLIIADTKSLVRLDGNQQLTRTYLNPNGYQVIASTHMLAPELWNVIRTPSARCKIEPLHVFLWGKNLYAYMSKANQLPAPFKKNPNTGAYAFDEQLLQSQANGSGYDFTAPIFQTPEGKLFRALIENTMKPNPNDRLTFNQVTEQLHNIQKFSQLHGACKKLIGEIASHPHLDETDKRYLDDTESLIQQATAPSALKRYEQRLERLQLRLLGKEKAEYCTQLDQIKSTLPHEDTVGLDKVQALQIRIDTALLSNELIPIKKELDDLKKRIVLIQEPPIELQKHACFRLLTEFSGKLGSDRRLTSENQLLITRFAKEINEASTVDTLKHIEREIKAITESSSESKPARNNSIRGTSNIARGLRAEIEAKRKEIEELESQNQGHHPSPTSRR